MTAQHTPGPWRAVPQMKIRRRLGQRYDIFGEGFVAADVPPKDAEFIVRACNCHDDLLEACKALVGDCETLEQDEGITACQCLSKAPDDITPPPPCAYCEAKAAIAKAEGNG